MALRGLYAITPEDADTPRLVARVAAALAGGARLVQYRNKSAAAALRREQAVALLAACRNADAPLIINDDVELAAAIGADGVHLGRDDDEIDAARAALGANKLIGISCYDEFERAQRAAEAGADYIAFGSVFPSATKPAAVRAPHALIARARRELALPVAAIGGVTVDNADQLIAAGASLLAVISDLFSAPNIAARAAAYTQKFSERSS